MMEVLTHQWKYSHKMEVFTHRWRYWHTCGSIDTLVEVFIQWWRYSDTDGRIHTLMEVFTQWWIRYKLRDPSRTIIPKSNSTTYGLISLKHDGNKIWNRLLVWLFLRSKVATKVLSITPTVLIHCKYIKLILYLIVLS